MLGAAIAIASALAFSLSDVAVRRGVARAPVSHAAFVTVLLGVPLFAIAALVTGQLARLGELTTSGYGLLCAAGIVHYVAGRSFNYVAIGAIGAARSSPVQALSLPYSVLIALLFLDEGITLGMAAGILLILIGPLLMIERRVTAAVPVAAGQVTTEQHDGFQLRQAEGYAFATLAALSYGTSPVLIRAALEGESSVSILGGFVSYVAAGTLLVASLMLPSRRGLLTSLQPSSVRVFFAAGFFVFLAQMLRFVALSMASVAVVATLLRFGSLFTLAASWILNRRLEVITRRVVIGVLISLVGAVLLVATQD
jgi:drug/metabolite transporter (DMT)-like permease